MMNSIQQVLSQLEQPDQHIPKVNIVGIDASELEETISLFRSIVFSGYFDCRPVGETLTRFVAVIAGQAARTYRMLPSYDAVSAEEFGSRVAEKLLERIPELRRKLGTDVQALFDNDPAAQDIEEVILCYPALKAMLHYRLAHELLLLGVPVLPRMITEAVHSQTGIDIHPGAEVGDYFSIDHGTGIVIGETCIIGNNVRLYQGVTLGARSFKFDPEGHLLREPRHPILEDRVVVYSNSSVLGRIRIGHDSIIGGNVWQTTDLPPGSRVVQSRATVSTFEHGAGI